MSELSHNPPITHQELVDASEDYLLGRHPDLKTIGEVVLVRRVGVVQEAEALENNGTAKDTYLDD